MITKLSNITHDKHEIDAKDEVLGRLATRVATLLVGKNKPYFVRHLDCGDFVHITNGSLVKLTGKKEQMKKYTSYSGYPGGLKTKTIAKIRETKPTQVLHHAIAGMLPATKLKKFYLERLTINA